MNKGLLKKHIDHFKVQSSKQDKKYLEDQKERSELVMFYQNFTHDKILKMNEEDIFDYLSKLWAMLIWGNKNYMVDKIILDNGLGNFRKSLANLVWGVDDIVERWDRFRKNIKGMGPAMISEILCKTHPKEYLLWNSRAFVGLNYLQVDGLPRYDYQLTGKVYKHLCAVGKDIANEMEKAGFEDITLLAVDYFIWDELQVEDNLSNLHRKKVKEMIEEDLSSEETSQFIHNDIRDKVRDIGQWLGFTANIEQKVSEGSKVDTTWEAAIGNIGRVIYLFEVQTKGSIDSLIINLLKALNNPAVQGVVAVSDSKQLEKIEKHVRDVKDLSDKLKYWDYEEILQVHEKLEFVNTSINKLGLVPQGF
ncbi:MAG: hypothetical protein JXI43_10690 [Tissierellales bacterium]|nr:hypothetical protein [Tissierellales bacterium]